jgi:hypothetical protein
MTITGYINLFGVFLILIMIYFAGVFSGDWWREKLDLFIEWLAEEPEEDDFEEIDTEAEDDTHDW